MEEMHVWKSDADVKMEEMSSTGATSPVQSSSSCEEHDVDEVMPDSRVSLFDLPLEILQHIMYFMDNASFFMALSTCKQVLAAAQSKPLLLHQINHMPGLRLGLEDLEVDELVRRFRSRAAHQAITAKIQGSSSHFSTDRQSLIARSAVVHFSYARPTSRYATLAVPTRGGSIHLYECSKRLVKRREELQIWYDGRNTSQMNILKMAFCDETKDLAVLCTQDDNQEDRFRKSIIELKGDTYLVMTYKLVLFPRCHSAVKGWYYDPNQQESRDILFQRSAKVAGLALTKNGTACIVWNDGFAKKSSLVWLVYRNKDLMASQQFDTSPTLAPAVSSGSPHHGKIFGCSIGASGNRLEYYASGDTFPTWYNTISDIADNQGTEINRLSIPLDFDEDIMDGEMKRRPTFHTRHAGTQSWVTADTVYESVCRWVELFLVEVVHDPPESHPSMFIACSESFKDPDHCDHANIAVGAVSFLGASNRPLALLGGYRQSNSTLGTILAISPRGTRICAAVWDHIYVWTFSPKLLTEGDLSLYFPARDYNSKGGFGRLRPSLISSGRGIIHTMFWTNEEIFYAVTDRGISKYDLSSELLGSEDNLSLTWDVWSTTARSEAAPGTREDGLPSTLTEYKKNFED